LIEEILGLAFQALRNPRFKPRNNSFYHQQLVGGKAAAAKMGGEASNLRAIDDP